MNGIKSNNDGLDVIERTHKKISAEVRKSGYVDGISSGRDSVFQDGFDKGYEDGFLNGFKLGFLAYEPKINIPNTTRGNCQICGNQELLNLSILELSSHQSSNFLETYQKILKQVD